ncbi:TPA_asm: hypothetical protein GYS95_12505 [Listeria monocytogenes]|nr:hypothetical protein [Listeria monocytogenes]
MSNAEISYSSERIRKLLHEVIQAAYESKESTDTLVRMKRFWFYFQAKESKKNGTYESDIGRILKGMESNYQYGTSKIERMID